jgi:hypothetical protein
MLGVIGVSLLLGIGFITSAAVLFLIVDVARNLRIMRFHAERTDSILRNEFKKM